MSDSKNPFDEIEIDLKRRHTKYVAELSQLIALGNTYPDTYMERGINYSLLEDYDAAIADFQEVVKARPHNIDGHGSLASAYQEAERFDEAIETYERTLELIAEAEETASEDFEDIREDIYTELGDIYEEMGDVKAAIDIYHKALEIDSENKVALLGLVLLYNNQGDRTSELAMLQRIVSIEPNLTFQRMIEALKLSLATPQ